ncbi:signal peptidase I [Altererythrobacter sp. MF3-039]|uniref:signal peptidase I n=1 Tax=Altererythrobacter sp. MF3-039 TaxID=3252901 RepID=UPI00390CD651
MDEKQETVVTDELQGEAAGAPAANADWPPEKAKKEDNFFVFLLKLLAVVLIFRSFIFSPFSIPSESMLPRLMNGDYLLASKWSYGFSKHSLPFSAPLIPGRIFASEPERGDVAIFKHPIDEVDYIKRVIGLPGDSIAVRNGVVILNGEPIPKERIDDFIIPVSANTACARSQFETRDAEGNAVCAYPRFRETLPSGATYEVLDFGPDLNDNFGPVIVPQGQLFVMGDNRDNSQDSRVPAMPGGGVGIVPQDMLVGRATILMWSTDGSSSWLLPWTWFTAARWDRLGTTL